MYNNVAGHYRVNIIICTRQFWPFARGRKNVDPIDTHKYTFSTGKKTVSWIFLIGDGGFGAKKRRRNAPGDALVCSAVLHNNVILRSVTRNVHCLKQYLYRKYISGYSVNPWARY